MNFAGPLQNAQSRRRALLIFAQSVAADLRRRSWAPPWERLLALPKIDFSKFPGVEVHFFTSGGAEREYPEDIRCHAQRGRTFGERLNAALEDLSGLGYDDVVVVGRDCPELQGSDIKHSFDCLDGAASLVLGPDHRGGCYLIGLHLRDRGMLAEVRWRQDSDFQEIEQRFAHREIERLRVKQDLDDYDDVRRLSRGASPLRRFAWALLRQLADAPVPPRIAVAMAQWFFRLCSRSMIPPPSCSLC